MTRVVASECAKRALSHGLGESFLIGLGTIGKMLYHCGKSQAKKAWAGCESPKQFAVKSRNRSVCGFFHCTSYGGAVGMAQAMPVFATRVVRPLTSNSTAAKCESLSAEFSHNSESDHG